MASPAEFDTERKKRFILLAVLTGLAVVLHTVEALFPSPIPYVKLGLANIITIIVLELMGTGAALSLTVIRVILGTMLVGNFLGPGFVLAMVGGLGSALVMSVLLNVGRKHLTLTGISAAGAYTHIFLQVVTVYGLFIPRPSILYLLPFLIPPALAAGILNGVAAAFIVSRLKKKLWGYTTPEVSHH